MSIPILTFFNSKSRVGKTSLTYHLAWMFSALGKRILAVDIDPQANLTAAFLDEEQLIEIWEEKLGECNTLLRCIKPLLETGDIRLVEPKDIPPNIGLIPSDLALSGFEETLSGEWPKTLGESNLIRPFRIVTAFWQVIQEAARAHQADIILVDVGPNLGAINRSALVASDFVVIPLGADLFSLEGLRNFGPTLRRWRTEWKKRRENLGPPDFPIPQGNMMPIGYITQQQGIWLSRPVTAYDRSVDRIPTEYRQSVLGRDEPSVPPMTEDPYCLGLLKHFHSLTSMAMEARKPLFFLKPADGAVGAHAHAVRSAYEDYEKLAHRILQGIASAY